MTRGRICRPGVFITAALIFVGACQEEKRPSFGSTIPRHPPDVLWINNSTEPEYLDPSKASGVPEGELVWNLFAGLVEYHPQTLKPSPEVATSWDISPDGKTYTFHMRETVWSDGTPLTASDFEYTWKRLLDADTLSKYSSIAYPIKNGAAFNQRALFLTNIPEKSTVTDLTAKFSKVTPIEKIELSDDPKGAFIYVGGEDEEKSALRTKLLAAFKDGHLGTLRVADRSVVGVKALDPLTLELKLESPLPYILDLLCFYTFLPVPRHVIERLEKEGKNPELWTREENMVNNGAYNLKEWKFRQYFLFEKNPKYWNTQIVRTPKVKVFMVESYTTALNFYRGGEFDWTGTPAKLPAEFIDYLKPYSDTHIDPYLGVYYYLFNITHPPLNNVKVRKAMHLAIDRAALASRVARAGELPFADMVPDGLAGYKGLRSPIFEPEKAKKLLAQAGYPDGKGFPKLTLLYNTTEHHKSMAEAIQQMWKKYLGIEVELENQEWKVYLKNRNMKNFDIARAGWIGDYPDPYTFLELFSMHNGNNNTGWKNAAYDDLLVKANRTLDREERLKVLREAETVMNDEQPSIPLYLYTTSYMRKPFMMGMWSNLLDRHAWKYIWIDPRWYREIPSKPAEDSPPRIAMAE